MSSQPPDERLANPLLLAAFVHPETIEEDLRQANIALRGMVSTLIGCVNQAVGVGIETQTWTENRPLPIVYNALIASAGTSNTVVARARDALQAGWEHSIPDQRLLVPGLTLAELTARVGTLIVPSFGPVSPRPGMAA